MKASPSLKGVVIGKRLFSRVVKTRSSKLADKALLPKIDDEFDAKIGDLKKVLINKLLKLTENYTSEGVKDYMGADIISKGARFSASDFSDLDFTAVQLSNWTKDEHTNGLIRALVMNFIKKYKELDAELKRKKFAITIGDELPAGIIQMAKVYIAKKRKIGVGDKMAGRHGNKGVVSRVLPVEDMPFLPNGRPLDIVLNPLGVPSRMNIGQVLEIHLSLAAKALGFNIATPVFDGASENDIMDTLELANDYVNLSWEEFSEKHKEELLPEVLDYLYENRDHRNLWKGVPISRDGKVRLRDGRTGEYFDSPVTIGHMHYLKLHHLVDDKIHARSTGPYSW